MHQRRNDTIRILSFNCLAIPFAAAPERLETLGSLVDASGYDLVLLQEIQLRRYLRLIPRFFQGYAHLTFAPGWHAPKGGLVTLSRLNLEQSRFTAYHERGSIYGPTIADRILGKGMLRTEYQDADLRIVVINTHLLANYSGNWRHGSRVMHPQVLQVQQLTRVVNAIPPDQLVIVGGDFNLPRNGHVLQTMLKDTGLHDALAENSDPTYRPGKLMPRHYAQAIDCIFIRCPVGISDKFQSRIRFQKHMTFKNGRRGFLSDHLGVETVIALSNPEELST